MTRYTKGEKLISQLPPQNADILYKFGQVRLDFLSSLNNTKGHIEELALIKDTELPAEIEVEFPGAQRWIRFRLWDKESWIEKHNRSYSPDLIEILTRTTFSNKNPQQLFFQLVSDDIVEELWFLTVIQQTMEQSFTWLIPSVTVTGDDWQASSLNRCHIPELLISNHSWNRFLTIARTLAREYQESDVLFCLEPLLCAAAFGLFAFVSLSSTGMSIDELLHISLDVGDWEIQQVSSYFGTGEHWISFRVAKRSGEFQYYCATPAMLETWRTVYKLHNYYCGDFKPLPANSSPSKFVRNRCRTYLCQWAGARLTSDNIKKYMNFLFHGNHPWDQTDYFYNITPFFLEDEVAPGSPPADVFNEVVKRLDTRMEEKSAEVVDWDSYSPLSLDQHNP